MKITVDEAIRSLDGHGEDYRELFGHGTLSVEIYKPEGIDRQEPHARDEIYVVASGTGTFVNAGVREPFERGDVLFVPAHVEHRFEDFTDDFATWVFFYGPEGGENAQPQAEGTL